MLIDCTAIAKALDATTVATVQHLRAQGVVPRMVEIVATDDAGTLSYSGTKKRKAEQLGVEYEALAFGAEADTDSILSAIARLNADPKTHGILIGMPTYKHIESGRLLSAIVPEKDVDGLGETNGHRVFANQEATAIAPATAVAAIHILETQTSLRGKSVTVIGRGPTVGRPVAAMLTNRDASVTVCHSRTPAAVLEAAVRNADIVVAATGRPGIADPAWFRPGQIVVDCGISFVGGKTVGDLDSAAIAAQGAAVTPVPRGVGTVTNATIFANLLRSAELTGASARPSLRDTSIGALFGAAASTDPTPGGGCVSAVGGYLGISLLLKAIRISARKQDKPVFAETEARMAELAPRLLGLAQADSDAFQHYIGALRLPKETDDDKAARRAALKAASVAATEVALDIMDVGNAILSDAVKAQHEVLPTILADAKACIAFAAAMNAVARENAEANMAGASEGLKHRLDAAVAETGRLMA
jgi:methylenetetrahydrofolate dehydrogenase (NADP+)/methenyltetrahydrofolate cyclohydrolase